MTRTVLACVVGALLAVTASAQSVDTVLRDMRQALGGDQALQAIDSFRMAGRLTRIATSGPAREDDVELVAQMPSRYVRVISDVRGTRTYRGFNGDAPVQRTVSRNGRGAQYGGLDPDHAGALRARLVRGLREEFARLTVPLFGAPLATLPLTFSYAGQEQRAGRKTDVVAASTADGPVFRLFVDTATHLPAAVTWTAVPSMLFTSGAIKTSVMPEPVEHTMTFEEFRRTGAITWPHRIKQLAGGKLVEELQISRVDINPALDERIFQTGR